MTCYFLKIPVETRLRIYQFLLPDGPIPAQFQKRSGPTSDGGRVYTQILSVNKQIHGEAADLLYRTRAFSIELLGDWLTMCNLSRNYAHERGFDDTNCAIEDQQWQQTFLGQQRLVMASQGRRAGGGASGSYHTPTVRSNQSNVKYPIIDTNVPIEPIWDPPLSKRYFDMIQFFRIEIVLPSPGDWRSQHLDVDSHKTSLSRLLDYCDYLHMLTGRLQMIQRRIARLEIVIRFDNAYLHGGDAFLVAQYLLRPLQRLRNIAKPFLSITIRDSQGEVELLTADWASSPAGERLSAYRERLFEHMSSSRPPPELPVFKAYWQLEKLFSYMREHYPRADPKIGKIAGLLSAARSAREFEDVPRFRTIWSEVAAIWIDCLNKRVEFQSNVALLINTICGTIQDGS